MRPIRTWLVSSASSSSPSTRSPSSMSLSCSGFGSLLRASARVIYLSGSVDDFEVVSMDLQ